MAEPHVTLRLPDGTDVEVGAEALLGRSAICAVRIDDGRVSSVHAELSWRAPGFVLLARGGRVVVGDRGVREVVLERGLAFLLAPGLAITVVDIVGGDAPIVPDTEGRDRLTFTVGPERIAVARRGEPPVVVAGVGARILAPLLVARAGLSWEEVAEAAWPEEGALRRATREGSPPRGSRWTEVDERRLRNRWDQQLTSLRRQLAAYRSGLVVAQRGVVALALHDTDVVEPEGTERASRKPNVNTAPSGSDA